MDEMKPNQLRVMTVEQANKLLPKMAALIRELHQIRDFLSKQEVEIDVLELVAGEKSEGRAPELDKKLDQYNLSISRFYDLMDAIHKLGGQLKDLDLGLIDFHTVQGGQVVYLCWRLGEDEVKYWHKIGHGYADRQPLSSSDGNQDQQDS